MLFKLWLRIRIPIQIRNLARIMMELNILAIPTDQSYNKVGFVFFSSVGLGSIISFVNSRIRCISRVSNPDPDQLPSDPTVCLKLHLLPRKKHIFFGMPMVAWYGDSETDAHVESNLCYSIRSRAVASKWPIFLHVCANCSQLLSNLSTLYGCEK